jgi:hypothetical protein
MATVIAKPRLPKPEPIQAPPVPVPAIAPPAAVEEESYWGDRLALKFLIVGLLVLALMNLWDWIAGLLGK